VSVVNTETRDAWQSIADEVSRQRPYVGRKVRVTAGRKRLGRVGTVIRHERDRFDRSTFRYGGDAHMHLAEMRGREGFAVLVQPDDGQSVEPFWIKASAVECISDREHSAACFDDDAGKAALAATGAK
jgi:hypothetical protein